MVDAQQAIARAKAVKSYAVGRCDEFVAKMYGFGSSGYATAVKNWQGTPNGLKHPGDWNAPAGALMYWGGGSTGAGHVAISLGNGSIISTDATGPGVVGVIDSRVPSNKWGHPYLGWAVPYFQGKEATGSLGNWTGATSVTNASFNATQISADSVTSGFMGSFGSVFHAFLVSGIWMGQIGLGFALIGFGIVIFARSTTNV